MAGLHDIHAPKLWKMLGSNGHSISEGVSGVWEGLLLPDQLPRESVVVASMGKLLKF